MSISILEFLCTIAFIPNQHTARLPKARGHHPPSNIHRYAVHRFRHNHNLLISSLTRLFISGSMPAGKPSLEANWSIAIGVGQPSCTSRYPQPLAGWVWCNRIRGGEHHTGVNHRIYRFIIAPVAMAGMSAPVFSHALSLSLSASLSSPTIVESSFQSKQRK